MVKNYFWDSCVFIAYLNDDSHAYDINSLETYISEVESGKSKIFTSTVSLAEVTPSKLSKSDTETFQEFLSDFQGSVISIDPSPYININAGLLKDIKYKKNNSNKRVLTTGDALMLATALELEETHGVILEAFHTYDNGRGKGHPEGKGVPLLDFDQWLDDVEKDDLIERVLNINICKPIHPQPNLFDA